MSAYLASKTGAITAPPVIIKTTKPVLRSILVACSGSTAEYVAPWTESQNIGGTFFWYFSAMSVVIFICSLMLPRPKAVTHLDRDHH